MNSPLVGLIMGSVSDWETMQHAAAILEQFAIPYETGVVSAPPTPPLLFHLPAGAGHGGLGCFMAGAGGAAHLPGMVAAKTHLPVLGVPVMSKFMTGLDSMLSIAQMPKGVPVATFAVGPAGAANAALFAAAMLASELPEIRAKLVAFRQSQTESVLAMALPDQP